jgi:hypothetical protein
MLSGFLSDHAHDRFGVLSDLLSDFGPFHAQILSDQIARTVGQAETTGRTAGRAFRRLPASARAREARS